MADLCYHAQTFAYLNLQPRRSQASIAAVDAWEAKHRIALPPAVREWYEIEGVVELWRQHMRREEPTPLSESPPLKWLRVKEDEEVSNVHLTNPCDVDLQVKEGAHPGTYLKFLHEIDCGIATILRLDGADDDPAVLLAGDAHGPPGTPLMGSFPAYVFDAFFDQDSQPYQGCPLVLEAQDRLPNEAELGVLRAAFRAGPEGIGGMMGWSYRFYDRGNWIVIGTSPYYPDAVPTWEIRSRRANDLAAALRVLWPMARLAERLQIAQGDAAIEALDLVALELGQAPRPRTSADYCSLGHLQSKAAWTSRDAADWREAIASYSQAIELNPGNWSALEGRARCCERIGEYEAAIGDYTTLLAENPMPLWYNRRATARLKAGRCDEALADMIQNLLEGRSDGSVLDWGEGLAKARRPDLIKKVHELLVQHSPKDSWTRDRFEGCLKRWGVQ